MGNIVEQLLITELTGLVKNGDLTQVVSVITSYLTTIGRADLAQHWKPPVGAAPNLATPPVKPTVPSEAPPKPNPHVMPEPHPVPHGGPPHPEPPVHA